MTAPSLPRPVADLAAQLADLPGVVDVVLGGSRATGTQRPDSDWGLGLYYRGRQPFDPNELRRLGHRGHVAELGDWGPIMNAGAWPSTQHPSTCRFATSTESRAGSRRAQGPLPGTHPERLQRRCANPPPLGELALCRPITGEPPRPTYPDPLAACIAIVTGVRAWSRWLLPPPPSCLAPHSVHPAACRFGWCPTEASVWKRVGLLPIAGTTAPRAPDGRVRLVKSACWASCAGASTGNMAAGRVSDPRRTVWGWPRPVAAARRARRR
jgi:hypothetical protein